MSKLINIALVGCGAVSELYYTPALHELEKIEMVRVALLVDPNAERTATIKKHFPSARVASDVDDVRNADADLAIVASPPRFHARQTIRLLQAGIAVLCEKPMAATVAEAEAMIDAAASARRVLAIGLIRRFFPASRTIRAILSQNILGEVRSFHFAEGGMFQWPVQSQAYFQRSAAVGGVLLDIGSHLLDLMVWWLGEPTELCYEDDAMGGIEANCRIQLTFRGGLEGAVRLSRDCDLPSRYVIQCSKGWLAWSANEAESIQLHIDGTTTVLNCREHEIDSARGLPSVGRPAMSFEQCFIAQLRNVIAAVQNEGEVFVSGKEALAGLRLIEKCYRQRTLIPMGWLGEREQDRAQQLSQEAAV